MDLGTVTSFRRPARRAELALAPGERLLAGGTWLFSEPQPEVSGLVDLTALGWPASEPLPDGGLRIAATCTIAELQRLPWPSSYAAELAVACADALLMSFKIQYAATVGGNVALGLPAAAMTALLVALEATALVWTAEGGERRTRVLDLVLAPGEVIRAFDVPAATMAQASLLRRAALADHGRTGALVIGRRTADGVVLGVTGSVPRPVVIRDPAELDTLTYLDDPHGAPDWRRAATVALAREVTEALEARS